MSTGMGEVVPEPYHLGGFLAFFLGLVVLGDSVQQPLQEILGMVDIQ